MSLRIGSVVVDGPKSTLLVIPREPNPIVFKFVSVNNSADFDKVFPMPEPRKTWDVKSQSYRILTEEEGYKAKVAARKQAFQDWNFLQAIKPSNIEWNTVVMDDPTTFGNWRKDFEEAGLNTSEINVIFLKYFETNQLTEEILTEARRSFLASQEAEKLVELQRQTSDSQSMESGVPASV